MSHDRGDTFVILEGDLIRPGHWSRTWAYLNWIWNKSDYHGAEFACAVFIGACGLVLANPFVDTFPSAAGFSPLADRAPEWVWALATLSIPFGSLYAGYAGNYWLRVATMFAAMWWLLFTGGLFTVANPIGFGPAWCTLAVAPFWAVCRLAKEWEQRAADTPLGRFTRLAITITDHAGEAFERRRIHVGLWLRGATRR